MQTPVALAAPLAMSPAPILTPLSSSSNSSPTPTSSSSWKLPKLRLHILDLAHPGSTRLLRVVNVGTMLQSSVEKVLQHLYATPAVQNTRPRSVTLIFRTFVGVAYTTGSELDPEHLEIHFSLDYIANKVKEGPADEPGKGLAADEITGVVTHELVHCFQYSGAGTAPTGLIEGIADWVRLKAGLVPPHWRRNGGEKWDRGYQTTAYFLEWCERCEQVSDRGNGKTDGWLVRALNASMEHSVWNPDVFKELTGYDADELWVTYKEDYDLHGEQKDSVRPTDALKAIPKIETMATVTTNPVYNAAPPPLDPFNISSTSSAYPSHPSSTSQPDPLSSIWLVRLQALTFDGTSDAKRFFKEFEELLAKVNPMIATEDKRLLLVTAFRGQEVNSWYEEADLEDEMAYETLRDLMLVRFPGVSARKARKVERDAKLE